MTGWKSLRTTEHVAAAVSQLIDSTLEEIEKHEAAETAPPCCGPTGPAFQPTPPPHDIPPAQDYDEQLEGGRR